MNPIFQQGASTQVKFIIILLLSLALLFSKQQIEPVRYALASMFSPLQYIANIPAYTLDYISESLQTRDALSEQNQQLLEQQLQMSERLQRFEHLKQENTRLRSLLGSPVHLDAKKRVTEVMAVANDPYRHYVVVPVGDFDGVYSGQPVIDDRGIIGQVTEVNQLTARVLLISDSTHAIPVRVSRNDIRTVAYGSGELDRLIIKFLPVNTDLKEGDLLVSSGLGGVFPEGYPVARVESINNDVNARYMEVSAVPVAALDRIRYLLLLWSAKDNQRGGPHAN